VTRSNLAVCSALADPARLADALWTAGFGDELIPIEPGQKRCAVKGWPTLHVDPGDPHRWLEAGQGLGLRCRRFPCIDVDILDHRLSGVAERAIAGVFGVPLLKRTGRFPKFAILCRADSRVAYTKFGLGGARCPTGKPPIIEILTRSQYVIHGIHPQTGDPYTWHLGDRTGLADLLAEVGSGGLPFLTPELVREELLPALQAAFAPHGITVSLGGGGRVVEPNIVASDTVMADPFDQHPDDQAEVGPARDTLPLDTLP
jgi:hypothetical protein